MKNMEQFAKSAISTDIRCNEPMWKCKSVKKIKLEPLGIFVNKSDIFPT